MIYCEIEQKILQPISLVIRSKYKNWNNFCWYSNRCFSLSVTHKIGDCVNIFNLIYRNNFKLDSNRNLFINSCKFGLKCMPQIKEILMKLLDNPVYKNESWTLCLLFQKFLKIEIEYIFVWNFLLQLVTMKRIQLESLLVHFFWCFFGIKSRLL